MSTHLKSSMMVEIEGDGEALLCIHGLGGSSNSWVPLLPAFSDFQLIRPDLPGSARSDIPAVKPTIDSFVIAMENLLADLNINTVHVVAHSLGTIVAQHFTVRNPNKVKSLALLGPLLEPPKAARPNILARAEMARSGLAGLQEIADAIVQGATSADTKATQPAVLAMVRECIMRQTPEGYAQSCEALATAETADIDAIRVPTLLITGDEDAVAPPENVESICKRIQGSRMVVLKNCGHWTPLEKPRECIEALRDFRSSQR